MLCIAVASIYMGLVHDKAIRHTEETSKGARRSFCIARQTVKTYGVQRLVVQHCTYITSINQLLLLPVKCFVQICVKKSVYIAMAYF